MDAAERPRVEAREVPPTLESLPMLAIADNHSAILAAFGCARTPHGVMIADREQAEGAYIHHTRVPVALAAFSLCAMDVARQRFPYVRLVDVVTKRPSMDGMEARALAAVCGVDLAINIAGSGLAPAFCAHLHDLIRRYDLDVFFARDTRYAIQGIDVRPRGVDFRTDKIDEAAIAAWRGAYKKLPSDRQMLVATILWLYRCGPDKTWLHRLPCKWYATDAILALGVAGTAPDWAKLVALYPGW